MAVVKAGHRYFHNNTSGVVYPWAPDLEAVKGLTLFTAQRDGEFDKDMLTKKEVEAEPEAPPAKAKSPRIKTVKYVAEVPVAPAVNTVEVPTASGTATIPAVNLTPSDLADE